MKTNLKGLVLFALLFIGCGESENEIDLNQQKIDRVCNCFEENQNDWLEFHEKCGGLAQQVINSFEEDEKKEGFVNQIMDCMEKYNP